MGESFFRFCLILKTRTRRNKKTPPAQFSIKVANIDKDIEQLLQMDKSEKRSLCFYPNGYKNKEDIEAIGWHFVDGADFSRRLFWLYRDCEVKINISDQFDKKCLSMV
jgi:hypothetical protein